MGGGVVGSSAGGETERTAEILMLCVCVCVCVYVCVCVCLSRSAVHHNTMLQEREKND